MQNFESYGFSEPIVKAITEMGFEQPTPIQEQTFPILLDNEDTDFLGLAQTGTGKTAAFGLPLLEKIDPKNKNTQAVILSPTRELSQQICQQMEAFTKYLGKVVMVPVFGGASIQPQIKAIKKGAHIIVGTPGRFIDLLNRGVIKLDNLNYIVLDEADEMLNMGFREDIDLILSHIEGEKNTWLFSATMPKEIRKIVSTYMDHPAEVRINQEQKTNKNIKHLYSIIHGRDKHAALKRVIDVNPDMYGIVFCKTRRDTEEVSQKLTQDGYAADYLNGDLSQAQRDNVMSRFKNGRLNLLIATDVAARGIDVNNLTHVIHYSLPDQLENYTHRSGRTGRAGNKGVSLSLVSGKDRSRISYLERQLKLELELYKIPLFSEVNNIRVIHWLKSIVEADESELELDATTQGYLETTLSEIPKALLVKKLLAKESLLSNGGGEVEDLNESPRRDKRGRDRDRNDRDKRGRRDRGERNDRGDRNDRGRDRSDRSSRRGGGSMVPFTLDIGSNVLSNKGHLLRLLCDETGLKKTSFGDLKIKSKKTVVLVDEGQADMFHHAFKGTKVKGHKIEISKGGDEGGFDSFRSDRSHRGRSGGGKRSGGRRDSRRSEGGRRGRRR